MYAFLVFTTRTVCLTHLGSCDSITSNHVTVVKLPVMQHCYESHDSSGKWQDALCATVAQFPIETRSVPHRFSTTSQQMSWDLITRSRARMWRIIASWYQIFTWAVDGEPFGRMLSRVRARNIIAVAQNSQVKHAIDISSGQRLIASVVEEGYQIPVSAFPTLLSLRYKYFSFLKRRNTRLTICFSAAERRCGMGIRRDRAGTRRRRTWVQYRRRDG